jgi:hypothetical protein
MKIVITMDWHTEGEVPKNIQGELQENAVERVTEMLSQGYRSGELCWQHNTTGEHIRGWWSISTEDEDPEIAPVIIPRETLAKLSAKTLEKLGLSISKNTPQFKGRMKNGK